MATTASARRIASGIYRRLNRNSTWGFPWQRSGDFVTFRWDGFVAAPSIPLLFARHHYETAVIDQLLGDANVQRSLEFGCGFGRLTSTFVRLSGHHTAIDIDEKALAAARAAYPDYSFRLFDGRRLPFADDAFDLVVSWTVLQHITPEFIEDALVEILRVLGSGGRLLLCEETRSPGDPTQH